MGTTQAEVDTDHGQLFDRRLAGPATARMLAGAQLRRLREAAHITRDDAGHAIRASGSKISRLELGRTGFKPRDVADLLDLYGVRDDAERVTLLALAKQANAPGYWRAYRDVVPSWIEPYLGLEQAASVIRTYDVQLVPALLQTEDYARAALRLCPRVPGGLLERQVRLRTQRQKMVLHRPDPAHLWAVIDEAALRRPVGGAAIMRAQFAHLIEMVRLGHVTVQVLPFSAGGHAAMCGPITLLRFPEARLADVVYLEHLATAVCLSKPAETVLYWDALNCLGSEAEAPTATTAMLRRIISET